MRIWVDADACPNVIKRFCSGGGCTGCRSLVANQPTRIPYSPLIRRLQVATGFDEADRRILELVEPGDLVITADIPLAAKVIDKGALALNPRGELYTEENVRERLTMRNLMDELRGSGVITGGPAVLSQSDRQSFANSLDRLLTKAAP
jgi:uncharacterized protein YaiI (UPF0178 family)